MIRIDAAGQTWELLPQRAALWLEAETLLITDPHFGKDATFRARGLPIPKGSTGDDLLRLSRLLDLYQPKRLLILGDFFHSKESRDAETLRQISEWRAHFSELTVCLISGNHDRHAGAPEPEWDISCEMELEDPPFLFRHMPGEDERGYVAAGHLHPSIRIAARGRGSLRMPCFHFTQRCVTLPAFGSFTGNYDIQPAAGDRVYAVGPDQVIQIPDHLF